MRAQICRRKSKLSPQFFSRFHGAQDGVFASEHLRGFDQVSGRDRAANRCAAHDLAVHPHRGDSDHVEIRGRAELFQQSQIARAPLAERPLMPDANFAQRARIAYQLPHEFIGRGRGELPIELQDEKMCDAEIADERDLVLCCCQQMRRVIRTQHFGRMRIERNDHWCATCIFGVARGSGNDCLMTKMHTIEDADGEEKGTWEARKF